MSRVIFRECGCLEEPGAPHPIAENIGYVFYCAHCDGMIELCNDTLEGLIEQLVTLRDGRRVDLAGSLAS
jgi:hypothetical protein